MTGGEPAAGSPYESIALLGLGKSGDMLVFFERVQGH